MNYVRIDGKYNTFVLYAERNFMHFLFPIQNTLGYTTDCSIPFGCKNTKKFQMELLLFKKILLSLRPNL